MRGEKIGKEVGESLGESGLRDALFFLPVGNLAD